MTAYRKFSDNLQSQAGVSTAPKPAKAPKVGTIGREILGGLAGLGIAEPGNRNLQAPVSTVVRAVAMWGEAEEEHAAIVEHDGNIPRAWAEGFARLNPDHPPPDLPARRWLAFINDIGRFLDSPFCAVAMALGWGPYDLFGCDRDRPFARIDQAGLLWLLNGDRLFAMTENTATIETRTGARQTYRRKPSDPGRVLAWELAP
jgi:hypothetical protein